LVCGYSLILYGTWDLGSADLRARIADAKRRNEMPIDSALGNPNWEEGAADGRLDVPDEEDDK